MRLLNMPAPEVGYHVKSPSEHMSVLWMTAVSGWLMMLILTPIAGWVVGEDETFPTMATLGVIAQCFAALVSLRFDWSIRRLLGVAGLTAALTWCAEYIGHTTGFPFGDYGYTDKLQPQLGGVPLLIPLAWLMMLPPAWAVTAAIVGGLPGRDPLRLLGFAALTGLAFTAWDLYLDPQMVARDLWLWDNPSGYFGIPWINFFGWWLTSSLVTLAVFAVFAPDVLPRRPLLVIYTLTWAFQAVGLGIFWGQPAPALVAFIVMGAFVALGWYRELNPHV